jgi:hypothetical protein
MEGVAIFQIFTAMPKTLVIASEARQSMSRMDCRGHSGLAIKVDRCFLERKTFVIKFHSCGCLEGIWLNRRYFRKIFHLPSSSCSTIAYAVLRQCRHPMFSAMTIMA